MSFKDEIFTLIKKNTTKPFDENSNIRELGIDSLDMVELIIEFEEKHDIEIPSDKINSIKTVGDLINLVDSLEIKK